MVTKTARRRVWFAVIVIAVWTGVPAALVSPAEAGWIDNFSGGAFDPRWGEDEPNTSLGEVTLNTALQTARFTAYGNTDMWGARNNAPILWTPEAAGDYAFETHVTVNRNNPMVTGITVYENTDGARPNFTFGYDEWGAPSVRLQGLGNNNPNIGRSIPGGGAWLRLEVYNDGGNGGLDRYVARYKLAQADPWIKLGTLDRDVSNDRVGLFLKTNGGVTTSDFHYAAVEDLLPTPSGPGTPATLYHRYSFGETGGSGTTLVDSVGGADGTIVEVGANDATVGGGQVTLAGGAKGSSDYVDLPDGILSSHSSATIEMWGTQHSVQNWSRLFDFGQDTTNNLLMSWTQGTNLNSDALAFKIGNSEHRLNNPNAPYTLGQEFHVVLVIDEDRAPNGDTQLQVFRDGVYRGRLNTPYDLVQLNDVNNWLGRSQYNDGTANASYNEFRIYDGALTTTQIRDNFADGPDALSLLPSGPADLRALPIHRWSFEETGGAGTSLIDSVGGAHGTIIDVGGNDGVVGGGQVTLAGGARGASDYVDLPDGLLSGLNDVTIEAWATQHTVQNWSRIFDFGNSPGDNLFMAWTQGTNLNADRAGSRTGGAPEQSVDNLMAPYALDEEYHIAMVLKENFSGAQTMLSLYRDGEFMGGRLTDFTVSSLIDNNNWIGRSQYGDNTANASWNEFRIYDYALTDEELLGNFLAGPNDYYRSFIIPEPASLALLGIGALALARRRRGK